MSARDRLNAYIEQHVDHNPEFPARLDAFHAETIAERDAEIIAWLVKKAREFRSTGSKQHALQADAVAAMADKLARGAVRANNMAGAPTRAEVLRRMAAAGQTPAPQPETAPRFGAQVKGRCPACGLTSLFLGNGGYVTCGNLPCPEPDAASTLLERPAPQPETTPDADEWVRCSGLHCPNAERFTKAAERGWQPGGMGTWQCPDCAPGAES